MDTVSYRPVEHRHEKIIIIAGGESLRGVSLQPIYTSNIAIVTVNNVIFHLQKADYWFTVDPMFNCRPQRGMQKQIQGTYYYCAFPDPQKYPNDVTYYQTVPNVHYLERIQQVDDDYSLCEDKTQIKSADSVYGAINLAYHMEVKEILLLGVDGYGYGHWYDATSPYNGHRMSEKWFSGYLDRLSIAYPQCLQQLNARGIKIINGSLHSRYDCFERLEPSIAINKFLC